MGPAHCCGSDSRQLTRWHGNCSLRRRLRNGPCLFDVSLLVSKGREGVLSGLKALHVVEDVDLESLIEAVKGEPPVAMQIKEV